MASLTHTQKPIPDGTTDPVLVPDRPQSKSYYWPASVHDRLARLADKRHASASVVGLEIMLRGLEALEAEAEG